MAERIWQRALKIQLPGWDAQLEFAGDDEDDEPEELEQVEPKEASE